MPPSKTAQRRTLMQRLGSAVDSMVYAFAPVAGARRQLTRALWDQTGERVLQQAGRAYEGADSNDHRIDSWLGSRLSPDTALETDLEELRHRSREIVRNDAVGGAVDQRVTHDVGTGFTPQAHVMERAGVITAADAKGLNVAIEALYTHFAKAADISRRQSLWMQTRLIDRTWATDGECLVVLSDLPDPDRQIPLAIEVVDVDRLETPPQHAANPLVRLGIEKDAVGRIVAYWIRNANPYDSLHTDLNYTRVDAVRVIHLYEAFFPEQSRGLPWLVRALNRVKDAKDTDEAAIIKLQVEACFAALVKTGSSPMGAAVGAASETKTDGKRLQNILPGGVHYIDNADEILFANPSGGGSNFESQQGWNYRRIAAAIDMPYEWLMRDWRGVSFAGGRLVLAGARLSTQDRQQMLIEIVLEKIWERIVDEGVAVGILPIDPRLYRRFRDWFTAQIWTPARWRYAITPGEEVDADIKEIEANLCTLEEKIAERGDDYERIILRRMFERQDELARGITPRGPNPPPPPAPDEPPQNTEQKQEPAR